MRNTYIMRYCINRRNKRYGARMQNGAKMPNISQTHIGKMNSK